MRYDSNQVCALPVMPMRESMDKRMLCLRVSNAADKSSRISAEDLAVALASFKASVTANRAVFGGVSTFKPRLVWIKEVVM